MKTSDFDFALPEALIAQQPLEQRQSSRLMHVNRETGAITHRTFSDLPTLLRDGDVLVLNDSRVIPARLFGNKVPSGGRVELLLIHPAAQLAVDVALQDPCNAHEWICIGQASKGLREGTVIALGDLVRAEVREVRGQGEYRISFSATNPGQFTLSDLLVAQGRLPLPPYVTREPTADDVVRYNTVFASRPGSIAAPTAGLHFTPALLDDIRARGVKVVSITLEVGPGTFLPVREDDLSKHRMHSERYEISEETATAIKHAKRVIAVGTTVTRTLEACARDHGAVRAGRGETNIFLHPGVEFRVIDALITNFHLPKSTLVMLVSAFFGYEKTMAAYRAAIDANYRFFSFGDAMFIDGSRTP